MPMAIIQPKSMTGRMPLAINEPKATIVVIAVYRHGTVLARTISLTRNSCSASGDSSCTSR